jgi:hypothetical protein
MRVFDKQQADMQKLEDFVRVNKANGVAASAKSKKKARQGQAAAAARADASHQK